MKCLAVLGSPFDNGTGNSILKNVKDILEKDNIDIEWDRLNIGNTNYKLCKGCESCFKTGECPLTKSDGYDFFERMDKSSAILMVVPSYIHQMPAVLKNAFDRMSHKMHEFPLLGKKVVLVSYSMSNGETELCDYIRGIFGTLGTEVVGAYTFNRSRDDRKQLIQNIVSDMKKVKDKVDEHKYVITSSQEQLYKYIRNVVEMEIEANVTSYKQKRWKDLMRYDSLVDYLRYAN